VSKEEAMDSVFGYSVANDLSARDWQMKRYILAVYAHPCMYDSSLPV
jgi:2-keto-4-pentenoate hydratase/2-oxohepta-3-ene-1,7-dioic acid hydratase in catechol pathway